MFQIDKSKITKIKHTIALIALASQLWTLRPVTLQPVTLQPVTLTLPSLTSNAFAQDLLNIKTEPTPEPLPSKETIISNLATIKEQSESTQKALNAPGLDKSNNIYRQNSLINDHLTQLKLIYEQQIAILDEIQSYKKQSQEFALELRSINTKEQIKLLPKSFDELENLRDEISSAKELSSKTETKLKNSRLLLEEAKKSLEDQEKSRRALIESLPSELKQDPNSFPLASKDLEVSEASQTVVLRRLEIELEKNSQKKNSLSLKLLKRRSALASNSALLSRSDFQRRLAQIEETEQKLKIEQEQTREDLAYGEKLFLQNKRKIESLPDSSASQLDLEKLDVSQTVKYSAQTRIRIITERLQRLAGLRKLWEARYNNRLKNLTKEELLPLREGTNVSLERLGREKSLQLSELDETRKRLSQVEDNLSRVDNNSKQAVWLKEQKISLEKLAAVYDESIKNIDSSITINNNFLAESSEQIGKHSWNRLIQDSISFLSEFWNYELFSSGDYPVTIGKLILGIFLIILGYFASDFLSRKLVTKLLSRFKLTQGATAAIQALTFYLLLIGFALAALRIANVPLTVFTVLGGALAIGVGFGSQNVMNNFISGLIILTEQPIRVGDLIQVESFIGIVKKIGARSTLVRTGNNIDIVVPNSAFLEKNVINWTRSNSQVRLNIKVGVDYNSDLELVTESLIAAVNESNKVLPTPKPFVWLTDFGDFSLNFEVHFWVNVRSSSDRSSIESEVRYAIYRIFKEKQITISFPHQVLQTNKAIEVRLLGNNKNV